MRHFSIYTNSLEISWSLARSFLTCIHSTGIIHGAAGLWEQILKSLGFGNYKLRGREEHAMDIHETEQSF